MLARTPTETAVKVLLCAAAVVGLGFAVNVSTTASASDPLLGDSRIGAVNGVIEQSGATWEIQTSRTELTLRGVDFVDDTHGWVVGGEGERDEKCVMRRTEDGGEVWRSLRCPFPLRLESVSFVDTSTGWAVGVAGQVVRTDDGGLNWQRQDVATTNKLTSVHFLDSKLGWISVAQSKFLLKTVDGGEIWQRVYLEEKEDISYVWFLDPQHGWALGGDGILLATTDGGLTWDYLDYGTNRRMYGLSFSDPQHGWIAGSQIRATIDSGQSWSVQEHPAGIDPDTVRSMVFFDQDRGYAVGDEGMIIQTSDGGVTWNRQQQELSERALLRMAAPNPKWLWAVGVKGTILRGHDADAEVRPTDTPEPSTTPTPEPSPTLQPTPTFTPTPEGAWVRVGDDRPFFVPPGAGVPVNISWGNMPATVEIVAQATGPVLFDNGEQTLSWTVSRSSGSGTVPVTVNAASDAPPGERFSLQISVDGHPSGRPGSIAWQAQMPWCGKGVDLAGW